MTLEELYEKDVDSLIEKINELETKLERISEENSQLLNENNILLNDLNNLRLKQIYPQTIPDTSAPYKPTSPWVYPGIQQTWFINDTGNIINAEDYNKLSSYEKTKYMPYIDRPMSKY